MSVRRVELRWRARHPPLRPARAQASTPRALLAAVARRGDRGRLTQQPGSTVDPFVLAVDVLATYRLTRLVTSDVLSEPFRLAVLRRVGMGDPTSDDDSGVVASAQQQVEAADDPPRPATLVTCRWCAGVWMAAAVGTARYFAPRAWSPVARALALSAGAVLLAGLEDD